jgi:hypothetical protein
MTDERFNELMYGPLSHPLLPFRFTRLMLALRAVVDSSPEAEKAFEQYCCELDRLERRGEQRVV